MRLLLVTFFVFLIILSFFIPPGEDKVVFLDVGQGDAILIQNGTQQVLIDGGQGMAVLEKMAEEMPWFDRKIDVVMLTHPQRDHMEGLLHVLERYDVDLILLPRASHTSQMQATWLQKIIDQEINYRFAWAGQILEVGEMKFNFLGPMNSAAAAAATKSDLNNASLVARLDFHELSFLLTGDAEKRVEKLLVGSNPAFLDADILKVGHHGSDSSTHAQLLSAVKPAAAVISVGSDNKFGHPRQEVLDRLGDIPIWRTDKEGSVKFVYTKRGWYKNNHGN